MLLDHCPEGVYVPVMDRNTNPTAHDEMMRLLDLCTRPGKENARPSRELTPNAK